MKHNIIDHILFTGDNKGYKSRVMGNIDHNSYHQDLGAQSVTTLSEVKKH